MIAERIFKTEKVDFELQVPVAQAMQNLGAKVQAAGKQPTGDKEAMVGSINQSSTFIHRAEPGSRNSFRPTFYGSFTEADGRSRLTGEITLNRVIQKFIVLWCSVVALLAVWTLITVLRNPAASWGSLIYMIAMLIACMAFCRFMIRKSSGDVEWLKREITRSANGQRFET